MDSQSPYIKDISEKDFKQEVIERSANTLVLVDFWAGWCNPCKILAPLLESVVNEYQGMVYLMKVDTDKEKQLAAAFGIRSLPTVALFKQGEIVETFSGVIPESEIKQIIDAHKFDENDALYQQAQTAFSEQKFDTALNWLQQILTNNKNYLKATILLARIHLQQKDFDKVDELLHHVGMRNIDNSQVKEILALNGFYREIPQGVTLDSLKSDVEENDSVESHFQLACMYAIENNYELALEEFLLVMQRDRKFKDDAARKNILEIFELLGGAGPLVNQYRVKMAKLLH